jgi:TolB-like protein/class 3 adenylate cyclase/Flp pilus assembly protein TadD
MSLGEEKMAAESEPDLKLEIAYILLLDIVGYSRLLVNEQVESLRELNKIVRSCDSFRAAEAAEKLVRVPTGDGMALLFFSTPEDPAKCALEISKKLQEGPGFQVRMGVHSGPINRVTDVNDQLNIAGTGINIAQRVMDCGDAGHIILSKHVADDLAQYRQWQPFLHDLGECQVKHGVRLNLVNLFKDGAGNPQIPAKLRRTARWRPKSRRGEIRAVTPPRSPWLLIGFALLLSVAAGAFSIWLFFNRTTSIMTGTRSAISEKSIAVLPFENLSDNKENAFFADGIQDEILTDLAKLADLKVISRTSVMQYRNEAKRNLREIAQALGVVYILEGSVQRGNDQVRISAQLIDARTDSHVWANRYDAALANIFAIQSEVAEKIVGQLKVKLSPTEKAAIERRPTSDLIAFDFYIRAKDLIERAVLNAPRDEQLVEAIGLLQKAIDRDPNFAAAYFQLAHAHDQIYFIGTDHTPARLSLAESAIRELQNHQPDSPEFHLAMAKHLYWCYRDYDGARRELAKIGNQLPNDPWPLVILGYMDRRQSRWAESTHNLERALELDPRNFSILQQIAITYEDLRRYPEAIAMLDRALSIAPDEVSTIMFRGNLEMMWHGDPKPFRAAIEKAQAKDPSASAIIAPEWLLLATRERNAEDATRALATLPADGCRDETILFPRPWCEGRVALLAGDTNSAQDAFQKGRDIAERIAQEQGYYAEAHCVLGVLNAALGHKSEAIQEGKRAVEMVPVEKDSLIGARMIYYLAQIYALCGEKDLAFQELELSARIPCGITYVDLLFEPDWDNLRPDPRFKHLLEVLAPKN